MSGTNLRQALDAYHLGPVADEVERLVRPCAIAATSPAREETLVLGCSKIGGYPDLPVGFVWPRFTGAPMMFLAQINFADVADWGLPLPADGIATFFYDSTASHLGPSRETGCVMIHPPHNLVRTEHAAGLQAFACCSVQWQRSASLPDPFGSDGLVDLLLDLSDEQSEAYADLFSLRHEVLAMPSGHQLLGYPVASQNCVLREVHFARHAIAWNTYFSLRYREKNLPEAKRMLTRMCDLQLLMQFVGDATANMQFIDSGTMSFVCAAEEFLQGDFTRPWSLVQFD